MDAQGSLVTVRHDGAVVTAQPQPLYSLPSSSSTTIELNTSAEVQTPRGESRRLSLTFHDLSRTVKVRNVDKKADEDLTLLSHVSGRIEAGQLVSLMGPSGSGKTTLLDVLAGRAASGVTGEVRIGGWLFHPRLKQQIGYVTQSDIFFEFLTVQQQLSFTARLRLPRQLSPKDKHEAVRVVMEQLGLVHVSSSPIMMLSGGERKRVSIATELLTNPSIVLLDEPTSGLDSHSAAQLLTTLRKLAQQGKTIVTAIHQPSEAVFHAFDHLYLLVDGTMVFSGAPGDTMNWLESMGHHKPQHENPADYLIELVSRDSAVKPSIMAANQPLVAAADQPMSSVTAASNVVKHNTEPMVTAEPKKQWAASWFEQVLVLYKRHNLAHVWAILSTLNLVQCLCISVLMGLLWLRMPTTAERVGDRTSLVYVFLLIWPLQAMFEGIMAFPPQRQLLRKERDGGSYRLSAFFVAQGCSEIPLRLVFPIISLIVVYWMANLNPSFVSFLGVMAVQLLCVVCAESLGLLISACVTGISEGLVLATVTVYGLMLVGGFYVKTLPNWLAWARWVSFFKYGNDASLSFVFPSSSRFDCGNNSNGAGAFVTKACSDLPSSFTGQDVQSDLHVELTIGYDFLILITFIMVFRFGSYIAFRFVKFTPARS